MSIFCSHNRIEIMAYQQLDRIRRLYLNSEGADVWFRFDKERVPAHRFLLTAMSPWLRTMFHGSLPEGDEVNMTNSNVTAIAFKEFLRFIYLQNANLTMDNIAEVIDLAKQSLVNEFFIECEDFLVRNLTFQTIYLAYHLALVYESDRVIRACKEDICIYAKQILRSSSFLKCDYVLLEYILRCDSLACNEKHVFNGCIAWAKSSCKRNKEPTNAANLRSKLKNSIYQIRFGSMTSEEFASCIHKYPDIFSANELREIICMITGNNGFWPKQFNWNQRHYDRNILYENRGHRFQCVRYTSKIDDRNYTVRQEETTSFTCNRRVLLNGFSCERRDVTIVEPIILHILVQKSRGGGENERCTRVDSLHYAYKESIKSYEAHYDLRNAIILQPGYIYSIKIERQLEINNNVISRLKMKSKVRVDHDIVFKFRQRGIVTSLDIIRFDNRKYLRKILHNPKTWLLTMICIIVLCVLVFVFINKFQHGRFFPQW